MNIEKTMQAIDQDSLRAMALLRPARAALRSTALILATALLCTACSAWREADKALDDTVARADKSRATLTKAQPRPAYAISDRSLVIATRSIPLSREAALPDAMRQVVFRFPGRYSLATIVERVASETGVPMLLSPDALMPASRFTVGGAAAGGGGAQGPQAGPAQANASEKSAFGEKGLSDLSFSNQSYGNTYELNYAGSFAGLLDYVAVRAGLQWKYEDDRILFYRVSTRTFVIKTLSTAFKYSATLSASADGTGAVVEEAVAAVAAVVVAVVPTPRPAWTSSLTSGAVSKKPSARSFPAAARSLSIPSPASSR